jgi:hypothetical protein
MHRPPLPPRKYSWYLFLSEAELTPMTPSRKETAICRLVKQCLNEKRHHVPLQKLWTLIILIKIKNTVHLLYKLRLVNAASEIISVSFGNHTKCINTPLGPNV